MFVNHFTTKSCGQPLDKEKPCCGAAVQMIDFIDQKVSIGASKDEIILATAHPAKFKKIVERAINKKIPLPRSLAEVFKKPKKSVLMGKNYEELKNHILNLAS